MIGHLSVAATPADIAGPASTARLLRIYVTRRKKLLAAANVGLMAQIESRVRNRSVTGVVFSLRTHRNVIVARAARQTARRSLVNLFDGRCQIRKTPALAANEPVPFHFGCSDHLRQVSAPVVSAQNVTGLGTGAHRADSDFGESRQGECGKPLCNP